VLDLAQVGPEVVLLAQPAVDRAGAAALDVRPVGRKMRREDQHGVPWIKERLAEELLEDLVSCPESRRPRPASELEILWP